MGLQPAGHQVLLFGPRPYLQIIYIATIRNYTVLEATFAIYVCTTTVTQYFWRLLLFFFSQPVNLPSQCRNSAGSLFSKSLSETSIKQSCYYYWSARALCSVPFRHQSR